ncbi:hypothetical protein RND71_005049 [Anisodus tanguticus]|uniref:Uncharacterized protein n=1 Tax=Anisodus tanguticus TaxID=243964 RepID=A0AAE1SS43_9SOLA|nr:hypothetical protein RND71_005049 [Anisodus tanguticus]
MEESEKRKERLKAMRMEASQSGDYNGSSNLVHGSLTNPLIDSSIGQVESYAMQRPRFDYYTDPMAAFSANKRSNNVSPQVSQQCYTPPPRPRNPQYPQSPSNTARGNYPVEQRPQSQGVHHTFNPLGNPGQNSPFGTPQRSSANARGSPYGTPNNYVPPNSSPVSNFASPGIHQGGRPGFHYGQGSGQQGSGYRGGPIQGLGYRGSPSQGSGYRGSPSQGSGYRGSPSQGSGYRGSPSQGSGCRGSPYQGSGHRSSPYQGSGRGRSQGMGRGRGSHGCTSAESRPDLFYSKSMVGDPWEELKPVIWKNPVSEKSWHPQSISAKKTKFPDASVKSVPQQSLAEYLSASFNEAASSEAGNDGSGT